MTRNPPPKKRRKTKRRTFAVVESLYDGIDAVYLRYSRAAAVDLAAALALEYDPELEYTRVKRVLKKDRVFDYEEQDEIGAGTSGDQYYRVEVVVVRPLPSR